MTPRHRAINSVLSFILGAALLAGLCFGVMQALSWDWSGVWDYRQVFWNGWLHTIWISLAALILSIALGLLTALARRSHYPALRWFAAGYVEIVRGTPLLVQLLILFYVVANAIGLQDRYAAGVIILAIFSGAYIAEMIRSGIQSVGKSQLESARAIGLTRTQTYRYVIFPQALRNILPPLAGQAASIIKDSSLLSILGIEEFTLAAQQVNSATYSTLESYLPLAVGYLVLTLPVSLLARWLEKKFRYET
ncbi:MAG: amino acid ABC transporter permease [Chthoniobacterales bacterium]